jgi:hypothetical protein
LPCSGLLLTNCCWSLGATANCLTYNVPAILHCLLYIQYIKEPQLGVQTRRILDKLNITFVHIIPCFDSFSMLILPCIINVKEGFWICLLCLVHIVDQIWLCLMIKKKKITIYKIYTCNIILNKK